MIDNNVLQEKTRDGQWIAINCLLYYNMTEIDNDDGDVLFFWL